MCPQMERKAASGSAAATERRSGVAVKALRARVVVLCRACLDVGLPGEADELGEPGLVDGGGDELAAEDDVGEQDGEVAAGLGVPALLVQHVPRDGHQVRLVRLRRVVHLAAADAAALARPSSLPLRSFGWLAGWLAS